MEKSGSDDVAALLGPYRAAASPLRAFLRDLHRKYQPLTEGTVADYIPELGKADPAWFAICVTMIDGQSFAFGDCEQAFTIQSISNPFVYGMALDAQRARGDAGEDRRRAERRCVQLDRPRAAHPPAAQPDGQRRCDRSREPRARRRTGRSPQSRTRHLARYIGHPVQVDMAVFTSERATGHRNRAIAHLMRNFDILDDRLEESLDLHFKQCSILVTCTDLAMMAATLANGGVHPLTGAAALDPRYVRDLLSLMFTCGMYDFAGEWAYSVGLPAEERGRGRHPRGRAGAGRHRRLLAAARRAQAGRVDSA